jgi:hypothetical protein
MGLSAQVIAIGQFSPDIAWALEYDESYYANVPIGATLVTNVFIACTSNQSHQLANAFGVGAMELGKHVLNPDLANIDELEDVFGKEDVMQYKCLAQNGFSFFYLPNA